MEGGPQGQTSTLEGGLEEVQGGLESDQISDKTIRGLEFGQDPVQGPCPHGSVVPGHEIAIDQSEANEET